MPGLIAFRRRWSTGSDDFVVPGLLLFIMHVILFLVIAIILGTSDELDKWGRADLDALTSGPIINEANIAKATCAHEIRNFSFGYLALIAVAAVIEIVMAGFSMQGTILDPSQRKPVEYLLYIRIAFGTVEMIYSIVSAVHLASIWKHCDVLQDVFKVHIGIVVVNIIVFLVVILVGYCVFDPNGGKFYKVKNAYDQHSMSLTRIERMRTELEQKTQETWLSRVSNCFCCVSNNSANIKQVALDEVSKLLYTFFRDYDLVMSDIIAGLTLLRHKQQCKENDTTLSECWCRNVSNAENNIQEFMCGRPITSDTNFVDLSNQEAKSEYEDMMHYCAYGLAAYGPLFYWVENSATGLCGVLHECLCGENPTYTSRCCIRNQEHHQRRETVIRGDSGCGWALAGIQKSLIEHGINADVVYVSFENEIYKQPFFVSVDHERKAVVVTVRGTLAEADALTDLVASAESIPSQENDGSWKGHKGMVQGADHIRNLLLNGKKILTLGFGHDLHKGTNNYSLVLVGHSLGAGVASILALLLRPVYPNLKCYAFSPPGGLLSHSAMEASKNNVRTVIFGKDVVPRAGLPQLENLRNSVIELLKHTDLPKYRIILGNLCGSLEHRHGLLRAERLSSRALRMASRRVTNVTNETTATELVSSISEDLYPPGKIYHLVYSSEQNAGCCSKEKVKKKYYLVHGDNVSDFQEIIVSHQMIFHHLPQEVLKAMKKVIHSNPNERINRTYAESATLPFVEKRSDSMEQKRLLREKNESKSSTIELQPQSSDPTSVTVESPTRAEDQDSYDSSHPFLNSNQNHTVDVETVAEIDHLLTSSSSSSSSLVAIHAPLAKPDSFTLSLPTPRSQAPQIPVSVILEAEVERDQDNAERATEMDMSSPASTSQQGNNSLQLTDPQASSTPFLSSKTAQENTEAAPSDSSFLDESDHASNQDTSSFVSCDDADIDMVGRTSIG